MTGRVRPISLRLSGKGARTALPVAVRTSPQRGPRRDYVRANIPEGTALASSNDIPTDIASTYDAAAALSAPVFLRDSEMWSIAELGHVFDPAQVNDSGTNTATDARIVFRPSGGRSFRIGQPENPFWDQGGKRAIQLLDLFSANPLGTNIVELGTAAYTNTPIMRGRVNVNTAPPEVLSAVFEGVSISSDEGLPSAEVVVTNIVDALVTNRPFSRISDLHKAIPAFANGTNFSPAITNATVTNTNATSPNVMAAMDRAREELFARTVNLLGTQSRAFRVYVGRPSLGSPDQCRQPVRAGGRTRDRHLDQHGLWLGAKDHLQKNPLMKTLTKIFALLFFFSPSLPRCVGPRGPRGGGRGREAVGLYADPQRHRAAPCFGGDQRSGAIPATGPGARAFRGLPCANRKCRSRSKSRMGANKKLSIWILPGRAYYTLCLIGDFSKLPPVRASGRHDEGELQDGRAAVARTNSPSGGEK